MEAPNDAAQEGAKDVTEPSSAATSSNDQTNEGTMSEPSSIKKRSLSLSEEKIEERKAANRRSAMESRERRKVWSAFE